MLPVASVTRPFRIVMALVLALSLVGAVFVLNPGGSGAQVGPSAPDIDLSVKPDTPVVNDGTAELGVYWRISGWTGDPDYYTFKIYPPGQWPAGTPLLNETSQGGADLTDIDALGPNVNVYNPENTQDLAAGTPFEWPDPSDQYRHKWTVPAGAAPGTWTAEIEAFTDDNVEMDLAVTLFTVEQATGDLVIFKYNDLNNNGAFDTGEPGLQNWQFDVTGPENFPGEVTDANGLITLSDITIGDYTITETLQAGWVNTDPGGTAPYEKQATVTTDGSVQVNFGNRAIGELVVFKYNDLNNNGTFDTGEPGLQNWQFDITGPESFPGELTDANGLITLSDISVGTYTVTETLQTGWVNTDPGDTAPYQKPATVTAGGSVQVNFGNRAIGELVVFKYNDLNNNGAFDTGEPGLQGWEFDITGPENFPGQITDANGLITLSDISVGAYTVTETLQSGWLNTDPGGTAPYQKPATVTAGGSVQVNFGNRAIAGLVVFKYNDLNDNGTFDTGEPGLQGWVFDITGPENFPGQITDANGLITLPNISVGTYTVTETLKSGWVNTDPGGTAPYQKQATLTPGGSVQVDFGNRAIGELVVFKYNDLNNNGAFDTGESALQGWQFDITGPENFPGQITDANGLITLSDISVGTYTVTETLQVGWECTDPGPGLQKQATVTAGGSVQVNFGNRATGSLVIFKYNDLDESGTFDTGESGLQGWRFDITGPESFSGQITDANGYITLTGISVGSYTITETLKAGWRCTDPGGLSPYSKVVVVDPGTSPQVEFGNYRPIMVPSLSQWGIIAMVTVFGGLLVWAARRRLTSRVG